MVRAAEVKEVKPFPSLRNFHFSSSHKGKIDEVKSASRPEGMDRLEAPAAAKEAENRRWHREAQERLAECETKKQG
eukprot:Skav223695  [mRNA]  locus=scaffold1907:163778:164005:+ [translate_table: standard]